MNILGEKTILRALEKSDCPMLRSMVNDPETEKMLGGSSFPVSEEEQNHWLESQTGRQDILRCAIAPKDNSSDGVGTIFLSNIDRKNGVAQVHIKLIAAGRGNGYGTDALRALANYAFEEMRLHSLYADVLAYNVPSQKLFTKCGFHRDGILRERAYKDGSYVDVYTYSLINVRDLR